MIRKSDECKQPCIFQSLQSVYCESSQPSWCRSCGLGKEALHSKALSKIIIHAIFVCHWYTQDNNCLICSDINKMWRISPLEQKPNSET